MINVLDAPTLLALLHGEPGADAVEAALDGSAMSCVNLSEVLPLVVHAVVVAHPLDVRVVLRAIRPHPGDHVAKFALRRDANYGRRVYAHANRSRQEARCTER
jgi:PIN domain nuclease of toxin-antitoxin system